MNTLIALAGLSILVLVLEIINLRKIIVPVAVLGLFGVLGITISDFETDASFYDNMIIVNKTNMLYSSLLVVLAIFLIAMSERFYKPVYHKIADYVSIKLILLLGAVCMVVFGNLTMFFLGLEILSISLYILAGSNQHSIRSNEAGMKYFLMGAFASGFILFGIALIYGATATFDISEILAAVENNVQPTWFTMGAIMITIGLLFKIAAFPFHFWAPDVYQGAPGLTTALMSTLAKITAIIAFFKLNVIFKAVLPEHFATMLLTISIATMFVGNVIALRQSNIKRMLAYSGVSHAGFMMMTLFLNENANIHLFYYATAYGLAGIAAFAVIISVTSGKKDEDISLFQGLARNNPLMATILSMSLLSMAGIPVFAGFFAKFFLFGSALTDGYVGLVICAVINSIISVYYYFKVIAVMFSNETEEQEDNHTSIPVIYKISGIIAIGLNIVIGLFPDVLLGMF